MKSNRKEFSLNDVVELVIDNRGRNPKSYTKSGIPVIDNYLITSEGEPDLNNVKRFIDQETYDSFIRKYIQKNDVLITLVGNGYGKVAITPSKRCIIIQNTIGLRCNKNFDNNYLYYLLLNNRESLMNLNRGAAQPSIKVGDILNLIFEFPKNIDSQKKIAGILKSLDDKIELNRQINQTLEQIAQAIFKSWFVDFDPVKAKIEAKENGQDPERAAMCAISGKTDDELDQLAPEQLQQLADTAALFPDELEESELGMIPKGWEASKLGKVAENNSTSFNFKNTDKVIFINTGDVLEGYFLHKDYSKKEGLPGQAKKAIQRNDILYSEIRPKNKRFCYVNIEPNNYVVSTKFMVIRSLDKIHPLFLYHILKQESTIREFNLTAESRSGTFPQITFDSISHFPIIVPNKEIHDNFINQLLSISSSQNKLRDISELLKITRDALLPKLLSGELSTKTAAKTERTNKQVSSNKNIASQGTT